MKSDFLVFLVPLALILALVFSPRLRRARVRDRLRTAWGKGAPGRTLEKELKKDNTTGTEHAILKLTDGLEENFVKRAAQAEHMHKLITASPHPTLVCGDFNSLPSSYTYHTMKGNRLKDGFQTCGHGYMYTFRYFKRLLRIDYIFHSEELEGLDYFSPELDYSDHNPVVMRMKIK